MRAKEFIEGTRWKGYEKKGMKTVSQTSNQLSQARRYRFLCKLWKLLFAEGLDENPKKWFKDKWVRFVRW